MKLNYIYVNMYVYIIVNNNIQHFIRNKILEKAQEIFDIPDICAIPDDIIDKAIINANCWQMYGSKKPDCDAYRVTKIYNYSDVYKTCKIDYIPTAKDEIDYIYLFSMRKTGIPETELLTDKSNEVIDKLSKCKFVRLDNPVTFNDVNE